MSHLAIFTEIVGRQQFGALPKRSATDLVSFVIHEIEEAKTQGWASTFVTLDVEGAFDAVLHNRLIWRMQAPGWPNSILQWTKSQSYLTILINDILLIHHLLKMSVDKSSIKKLQGSENYAIWAIRMEAVLHKEMTNIIIETDDVPPEINSSALSVIQHCLDDGPLLQKAPSNWNHDNNKEQNKNTQLESCHSIDDNEVDVLYTRMDYEVVDLNMTDNHNEAEVYVSSCHDNRYPADNILEYPILNALDNQNHAGQRKNSNCFILDSATTKHIICDKRFFINYQSCDKT
ncbi:hypothetical protein EPUL_004929, partial [Erysiphe pulchra]